jgi:valyl-tRNA synthetase
MDISTHYNPSEIEHKWYQYWLDNQFFKASPNPVKSPYTVIMPPPNITGTLHMGHMLNNTIQDVLVRKARMQGKEACWVPGIDHASIATEARVVAALKEKHIQKKDLSRSQFLDHVWEWKKQYGNTILEQVKRLGVSCDWDRLCFTMDDMPSKAVYEVFIRLYEQGYIYQGVRMINWDPAGKTALADDEVIYRAVESKLYYIRYQIADTDQYITVATSRPETIFGDTAICVHPEDERYQHLHNQSVIVPIIERTIPIITDTYVDKAFGTGCLKVTPAHSMSDYELGQKHQLAVIDVLNEDGTMSPDAQHYVGEDRFVVREKVAARLAEAGLMEKVVPYTSNIGFSERTQVIVEPRISKQWFLRIQDIAKPALTHVLDGTINFHPAKFKNMYQQWLENVHDWCISRQLWWGHQIPAFYLPDGQIIAAHDKEEALAKAQANPAYKDLTAADLRQDEDVLDTWFSAWLWPISVFDGINNPNNADMQYFYPTHDVVTAPEIIFFWIARMIMAGYAFTNKPPFKNVYFTGIVRDKEGKKMSKSLGNSPDTIELIQSYGADGVRVGMLLSAPAGNDLLFDEKLCLQGRNFANKLWNAFRLIQGWQIDREKTAETDEVAIAWFNATLQQALSTIESDLEQFRISNALMTLYNLIWDGFCAAYLEMIKPAYGQPIASNTYTATVQFLESILKLLHPFMPFITEEIWQQLAPRKTHESIMLAQWPNPMAYDTGILKEGEAAFALISEVRNIRATSRIPLKEAIPIESAETFPAWLVKFQAYIQKLSNASTIRIIRQPTPSSISCNIQGHTFYVDTQQLLDSTQEIPQLQKDRSYYQGFITNICKKLENPQFMAKAPQHIVDIEQQKKADAIDKLAAIDMRLKALSAA